jgi:hypothetical protein
VATLQILGELDQAAMMRCALTVRPRLRGITVATLSGAIGFMLFSSLLLPLAQRTSAVLLACTFAIYLLYVFHQEKRLACGFRVALAEVNTLRRFAPSEGFDSCIEYSFASHDGREYRGRSRGVRKRLPPPKWLVPVAYNPGAPDENQPFATFWFFQFDYDGTELL